MGLLAAGERAEEDRDHARLAVRILARPVHVGVAQGDVDRPVQAVVRAQVLLAGQLGRAVRGHGLQGLRLERGLVALAVDRAAGRAEDDLGAVAACRLEDVDRPEDVHGGILVGTFDCDPDVRLGGEVEDRLGPHAVEDVVERLANVVLDEVRARGDVLALARHERVHDDDVVAASREGVDDVGSDEAGAAGDDRAHAPHPTEGEVRDAGPP